MNCSAKVAALAVLLATVAVRPSFAQTNPQPPGEGEASPPQDSRAAAREQALDLFEQSKLLYRKGEFQQAAVLLRRAHAQYPEPVLVYNLARALESMGEIDQALDAYAEYLRVAKADAPSRASAEQRAAALRRRVAERERLQQRQLELEEERRRAAEQLRQERRAEARRKQVASEDGGVLAGPVPWIVVGAGAAGLVVGGGLLGAAHSRQSEAVDEPSQREASNLQDSAERLQTASAVSFIAGGVFTAAGVTLLVLRARGEAGQEAVRLEAAPTRIRLVTQF